MDESQTSDKIKVLNVFQNEEIANKSPISNKFEFEKGVIRNAIVSSTSNRSIKTEKEKLKKNCIIFREQCEYCLTDFSISGHLILTKESLLFEPDLRDKNVIKNGLGTYQIFIDLYDIYECAHIVVPTKYTYLYNNDDTCGFIQVLLKSIYIEENKILSNKKSNSNGYFYASSRENSSSSLVSPTFGTSNNNNLYNSNNNYNDESNKQKGMSYYRYISKSISYVLNLAQPLVQNTPFKGYKADQINTSNDSVSLTKHVNNDDINDYNKSELANETYQGTSYQNEQNKKTKRNSFINFDISSPKNNIINHMHDSDLKIYQNINEINYSKVISSHPNITYKNNFNSANYSSYNFKGDNNSNGFNKSKKNSYPFIKKNSISQNMENTNIPRKSDLNDTSIKNNILTQLHLQNSNKTNTKITEVSREKQELGMDSAHIGKGKTSVTPHNGELDNFDETSYVHVDHIKREDIHNLVDDNTNLYIKQSQNIIEMFPKKPIIKTSDGITYNNEQDKKIIKIKSLHGHIENEELYKKGSKKYEEKCFILFRFFNNNTAYETTTKIITEIDNVKKSENKIKKTITSVPFTSNELLKCIIKQSLIYKESNDLKQQNLTSNPMNDMKDFKSFALEPKLDYVSDAVKLLTKDMSKQINYYLPPTLSIKVWKLAFCSSIHGVSFKTLYRSVANKGSIILLIHDINNVLFGCFLDKLQCDTCYYGSGENFLFTFKDKSHNTNYEKDINKQTQKTTIKNIKNKTITNDYDPSICDTDTDNFTISNRSSKKEDDESEREHSQTVPKINEAKKNKASIKSDFIMDSDCSELESTSVNKLNTQYDDNLDELTKNNLNQEIHQKGIAEYPSKSKSQTHYYDSKLSNKNDKNKHGTTNSSDSYETKNKKNNNNNKKNGINKKENNNKVNDTPSIQVYNWTTRNNYYVYSDEHSITIGGGDNYALVINDDLCKGQTNKSTTYDNDLLTYDEEFEIQFLQLWIFDDT
ncbi:TLD domain-containing protein [Plasmodium chabaudi chabaudi]|uniref:Oxidation resistance protein 1 n=1 Tax=Plasmodium chabaudi chabaudi TaxID=31271 RepID=A0A1D3RU18_PLACU|nr:TLD domain-containing protein [Plasmodium chabaudi chabaudi]